MRIVAVCLLIALFGCSKKRSDPGYYLKFKVDGVDVVFNGSQTSADTVEVDSKTRQYKFLGIVGSNLFFQIVVQVPVPANGAYTGGTYQLTSTDSGSGNASMIYGANGKDYQTNCSSTGSVQLQYDANHMEIRGTFSGDATGVVSTHATKTVSITDGEMYMYFLSWN